MAQTLNPKKPKPRPREDTGPKALKPCEEMVAADPKPKIKICEKEAASGTHFYTEKETVGGKA